MKLLFGLVVLAGVSACAPSVPPDLEAAAARACAERGATGATLDDCRARIVSAMAGDLRRGRSAVADLGAIAPVSSPQTPPPREASGAAAALATLAVIGAAAPQPVFRTPIVCNRALTGFYCY